MYTCIHTHLLAFILLRPFLCSRTLRSSNTVSDDARKTQSAESGTSNTLKKKRRDLMKTLPRPENASAANVSHPVEDEISPRREKSESNNARQGRSWERAGSSINGISGFPSRARGKAIRHIFKQQPVRLCQRGGVGGWGICRERLFRGVNCGKQLERLSWRVCFFSPSM